MLFAQKAPEGEFLSAKPPWGAPAALSEPLGAIGWAGDKLEPGLRHPQGFRRANASEAQVLHELALAFSLWPDKKIQDSSWFEIGYGGP